MLIIFLIKTDRRGRRSLQNVRTIFSLDMFILTLSFRKMFALIVGTGILCGPQVFLTDKA